MDAQTSVGFNPVFPYLAILAFVHTEYITKLH